MSGWVWVDVSGWRVGDGRVRGGGMIEWVEGGGLER